jgi:NADH:ubiquinone oxidoreductase subunit 6 (subunit J)
MKKLNVLSIKRYFGSGQSKFQKAVTEVKTLWICLLLSTFILKHLGALLTWLLYAMVRVLLTLGAVLFLIGQLAFGKRKSCTIKESKSEQSEQIKYEGEISVLFIFLILNVMRIYSWFSELLKTGVSSQTKATQTITEVGRVI